MTANFSINAATNFPNKAKIYHEISLLVFFTIVARVSLEPQTESQRSRSSATSEQFPVAVKILSCVLAKYRSVAAKLLHGPNLDSERRARFLSNRKAQSVHSRLGQVRGSRRVLDRNINILLICSSDDASKVSARVWWVFLSRIRAERHWLRDCNCAVRRSL